jgi:hypothetical protein
MSQPEIIDLTIDDPPPARVPIRWPGKTIGDGIFVAPSKIPGAGNGLFAAVRFERGDVITIYDGARLTGAEAREPGRVATHLASICTHEAIDGLRQPVDGCGGGSFINDPRYRRRGMYNAELVRTDIPKTGRGRRIPKGIHIQANMPIAPGDEIYASYGRRGFKRALGFGASALSYFI